MDSKEFTENAPGQLVPTHDGAFAFVPEPIPENIKLPPRSIRLLSKAENAMGILVGITDREVNPYLVGSPLLRREAILSSRIEGTVTTPEQLMLFESEQESLVNNNINLDTKEVGNYVKAMQQGIKLLEELPICLRLIREIHKTLLSNVRGEKELPGEFRRDQNWIRGKISDRIEDARFVPPPVAEMRVALDRFEEYLNKDQDMDRDPILIQLPLIHYQFETIHPFRDGNGRIGRLLLPLLMMNHNRLDTPTLYLSGYFEKNRDTYQDLLLRVSQTGDWISWIDFFLRGVIESAEIATNQVKALLSLRKKYHEKFQKGRSSALLMKLVDSLFQKPAISINEAADLLDVTHQSATNNINKLVKENILKEITGQKRYKFYVAPEILAFMRDHPE